MQQAPLKLICRIVRAIGQLRVHCVKMQYEIAAQQVAVEKTPLVMVLSSLYYHW